MFEDAVIDPGRHWRSYSIEQEHERATAEKLSDRADTTPLSLRHRHRIGFRKIRQKESIIDKYKREIEQAAKRLNIPEYIVADAKKIFFAAREKGLLKGRSYKTFIAASFYAVCKHNSRYYISLQQLEEELGVKARNIVKTYSLLVQEGIIKKRGTPTYSPADHIPSLISKLNLENKLSRVLSHMVLMAKAVHRDVTFQGKHPRSLAAAIIYLFIYMLSYKVPQSKVAEAAEVAPPTIRRTLSQISQKMEVTIEV